MRPVWMQLLGDWRAAVPPDWSGPARWPRRRWPTAQN